MKKLYKVFSIGLLFGSGMFLGIHAQTISTYAGNGTAGFSGDGGLATAAKLNHPVAVAVDAAGNVYIADENNSCIRKIAPDSIITTIAGNDTAGYSGDGGMATAAEINYPEGLAVDGSGNVYIADYNNDRIRKVTSAGIITTIAGTGAIGYTGDGGAATAAELNGPTGIAVDAAGNIYIADENNHRVRKISSAGIISTIAGTGVAGFSGDGGAATAAKLWFPNEITTDAAGNVYIADNYNSRVREINSTGVISTITGNGTFAYGGDKGIATAAKIYGSSGLALDASGNVYIADWGNSRIRRINTADSIFTIAGKGVAAYGGDGGPATAAGINGATGITVDVAGDYYIADYFDNRVRKVSLVTGIDNITPGSYSVNLYPNPNSGQVTVALGGKGYTGLKIFDMLGREIYSQTLDATQNAMNVFINMSGVPNGVYIMQIKTRKGIIAKRIELQK